MKTFKLFPAIGLFLAMQFMTSCLGSGESSYKINSNLSNLFNAVYDIESGEMTLYGGQAINVEWEYSNSTAKVEISGLKLPDGTSFPLLQFSDLPWKQNSKGWLDITAASIKPTSASGYVSNLTLEKFNLQLVNRVINNLQYPAYINISYNVDNRYRVYALPSEMIELGRTNVTDNTGSTFSPKDSDVQYIVHFDTSTQKAFIVIIGAQFAEKMPALNMKFADIPFSVTPGGQVTMACESLVPAILKANSAGKIDINDKGTPYENFPISNLVFLFNPNKGVTLNFNCNAMGTNYSVSFICDYPDGSTQTITPTTK